MCKCILRETLESIEVYNIIYNDSTDEKKSSFDPGQTPDTKKLIIKIHSNAPFHNKTRLTLKLVAIDTYDYQRTKVTPILSHQKLNKTSNDIVFTLTNNNIPIPFGLSYIPQSVDNYDDISIRIGDALEYHFLLYVKCCHKKKYKIPLTTRYIGSDAVVDFKCEKIEVVSEKDDDHPIEILVGSTIVYGKKPHCVTHGQVKKIEFFYYTLSSV